MMLLLSMKHTKLILDDLVVGERGSVAIDLAKAPLVDETLDTLQVRVSVWCLL